MQHTKFDFFLFQQADLLRCAEELANPCVLFKDVFLMVERAEVSDHGLTSPIQGLNLRIILAEKPALALFKHRVRVAEKV